MKTHLLLFLLLSLVGLVSPQSSRGLGQGTDAAPEKLEGTLDAYCSTLRENYKLCRATGTDYSHFYMIYRGPDIIFHGDEPENFSTSPDTFFAYRTDLDNDGKKEIVFASLRTITNGMSVGIWDIYIFPKPYSEALPVRFTVEDFGPKESISIDPKTGRAVFLITYWKNYDSLDLNRGPGLYFVGKYFEYDKGRMVPILSRPAMARRYLFGFQDERNNTIGFEKASKAAPLTWLRSKTTHRFFDEPSEKHVGLVSSASGVIQSYEFDAAENSAAINILFDDGNTTHFKYSETNYTEDRLAAIGLDINGKRFTFPENFDVSLSVGDIKGKRVKVEKYGDRNGFEFSKMWFISEKSSR